MFGGWKVALFREKLQINILKFNHFCVICLIITCDKKNK